MKLLSDQMLKQVATNRLKKQYPKLSVTDDLLNGEIVLLKAIVQEKLVQKFPYAQPFRDYNRFGFLASNIAQKAEAGIITFKDCSIEQHLNERLIKQRMIKDTRTLTEHFLRTFDPYNAHYCSNIARQNRLYRDQKADEYAEKHQFFNKEGEIVLLPTQEVAAQRQYAQLLARSKGALASGAHQGADNYVLVTITAPQEFHPSSKHYNATLSATDSHRFLQKGWERFRANVAKTSGVFEFVKAVQPHKSSTAHFHVVIATTLATEALRRLLDLNFDGKATEERARHGIQIDQLKGGVEGAVAYVARTVKYLARAMAGESSADADEALATKEWASIYRIRRFTTSQDAVTVWRTIMKPECNIELLQPLREARKAGDYATFLNAVKELGIKPSYALSHTADGAKSAKIVGLEINDCMIVKFDHFVLNDANAISELQLIEKNQGTQHRSKKKLLALVERLRNFPLLRQKYLHILEAHYKDVAIA